MYKTSRLGLIGSGGGGASPPPWTPLDDPDTILFSDARLSTPTESGGFVDQLTDLSPFATHLTATTTRRGIFSATAFDDGMPGVTLDGTDDFFSAAIGPNLVGATGVTLFLVVKGTNPSGSRYWLEYGASGGSTIGTFACIANSGGANRLGFYTRGNVGTNNWISNVDEEFPVQRKVLSFKLDLSAAAASEAYPIRVDGVDLSGSQVGTNENTSALISRTLTIGATATGTGAQSGVFGAIVVVKRALNDADRAKFEQYLGQAWNQPFAVNLAARAQQRILWVCQSNGMGQLEGFGTIEAYDEHQPSPPWVYAFKDYNYTSTWFRSTWGAITENPGSLWEGPDLVTAMWLLRRWALRPEIIMCARGATSVAVDWNPSGGAEWTRLSTLTWPDAISTHPAAPASPAPWIVLVNGESDTTATHAPNFATNLPALIAAIRGLSGLSAARVVIVKVHPSCALGTAPDVATVRAAQDATAAADVIGAYIVETSDLVLQGDSIHLNQVSAITMGKRVADTIAANS